MNGVHDMGGQQGFGPVLPQADEALFHAPWEKRALALTLAMGATGLWNIDLSRSARESLPAGFYLDAGYYAVWLRALELLMRERGLVEDDELESGILRVPGKALTRTLKAGDVDAALAKGAPTARPTQAPARFKAGDRVRARNMHPSGHTRLPRYVRGHVGTVQLLHGSHVFADAHASRQDPPFDDCAHWLYTVVFDATTLWGPQADARSQVSVDAWEPYLEWAA